MILSLKFYIKYFAYWLVFFFLAKGIFILFNYGQFALLDTQTRFGIFKHGLKLDLSMSAYFTMAMGLLYILGQFIKWRNYKNIMYGFHYILATLSSMLIVVDARLYHYWGFKLDLTAFRFLSNPSDAAASVQWSDLLYGLIGIAFLILISILSFNKFFIKIEFPKLKITTLLTSLLLTTLLILPIRGGIGVATLGLSSAYFSSNNFANHAAINTAWNLMYAKFNTQNTAVHFDDISEEEGKKIYNQLYPKNNQLMAPISIQKPTNVVLIVLESFSKGLVGCIGGAKDVTPNLNRAAKNGWNFKNFYSSGDRSDKGLSSLFTGTPGLPEESVLRFPDKVTQVPHMYKNFIKMGYETSAIYGGNWDFANLRSLFATVDNCQIIGKEEITIHGKLESGKWGIHDQHTFAYLTEFISSQKQPFFTTLYTLSSHEPFDVPHTKKVFTGSDAKSYRAAWYTDSCLGVFLNDFAKMPEWENTLVIITADHGIRQPGNIEVFHPDKFQIPLVFTGGVINSAKTFDAFKSHTDLPYTLQWWLTGMKDTSMIYSSSLFDSTNTFANFFYQVGSGMIDETGCAVYDVLGKKLLYQNEKNIDASAVLERKTRFYLQHASNHFSKIH